MTTSIEPDRPTILFLHIPKTAGLTLRDLLRAQYPRDRVLVPHQPRGAGREAYLRYLRGQGPRPDAGKPRNEAFKRILSELPPERLSAARVVMGHFWFGLHEAVPGPSTYVTVVRDPIDRVLSMYHHRRTRHGLDQSVDEYVRAGRDLHIDNDQTRRLANDDVDDIRSREATPEMFERAVRNLEAHFGVAGTTERFDALVVVLANRFGWDRVRYVSRNVARGRPRAEELDAGTLAELRRRNEYDLELHRIVRSRFDEVARSLDMDVDAAAEDLRRRSERYTRTAGPRDRLRTAAARLLRRRAPATSAPRGRRHPQ